MKKMISAGYIPAGTKLNILKEDKKNGKSIVSTDHRSGKQVEVTEPYFESVGKLVGGYIEIVRPNRIRLIHKFVMIVNEEGRIIGLPFNQGGYRLYGDVIAGDVVFMKEDMTEEGPDLVDCTEDEINDLTVLIMGLKMQ